MAFQTGKNMREKNKIFGGGKSPVASLGIDEPSQTPVLYMKECRQVGDDLLIRYGVRKVEDV